MNEFKDLRTSTEQPQGDAELPSPTATATATATAPERTTLRFLLFEVFKVFNAKANTRTTRQLQQHAAAESYVHDDRAIYIKPDVHSKQVRLVKFTEKNFEARISRLDRNFLKRKPGCRSSSRGPDQPYFEYEILTYVKKDTARCRARGARRIHGDDNWLCQYRANWRVKRANQ